MSAPKPSTKPWEPWTGYTAADARAFGAFDRGEATPEQQRRVMAVLIETLCGYYDLSYRPGDGGDRDTAFAEGKRFVGAQIVKLTKINPQALTTKGEKP